MPSTIRCTSCGRRLRVPDDKGALRVTCPSCKAQFDWPAISPSAGTGTNVIFAKSAAEAALQIRAKISDAWTAGWSHQKAWWDNKGIAHYNMVRGNEEQTLTFDLRPTLQYAPQLELMALTLAAANSNFDEAALDQKASAGSPISSTAPLPVQPLIQVSKFPTMPMMWMSEDAGETWVWGEIFATFQKRPPPTIEGLQRLKEGRADRIGMRYHYCLTVFYRRDRSPHGPSSRPILVVAIEQTDYAAAYKYHGTNYPSEFQTEGNGPLILGLFAGDGRWNLGEYEGQLETEAVRRRFFEIVRDRLPVNGYPERIGSIQDAYGNPRTGVPRRDRHETAKKSGCATALVIIGLSAVVAVLLV